jgi:peptidyl-tRNA hydrolase, PTH1 family
MWLVVGLGNPGSKYERNRHNIGFRVVDEIARRHGLPAWKGGKLGGDTTTGIVETPTGRTKALLLKPMEFMNLSGYAVQKTSAFHHVDVEHICVVHDEIDLEHGVVRVKNGGGHGGHNGLRSIIEQLGGNGFARVRVGVGKLGDAAGYVLNDFPSAQAAQVDRMIAASADAALAVVGRGVVPAMNEFNGKAAIT